MPRTNGKKKRVGRPKVSTSGVRKVIIFDAHDIAEFHKTVPGMPFGAQQRILLREFLDKVRAEKGKKG